TPKASIVELPTTTTTTTTTLSPTTTTRKTTPTRGDRPPSGDSSHEKEGGSNGGEGRGNEDSGSNPRKTTTTKGDADAAPVSSAGLLTNLSIGVIISLLILLLMAGCIVIYCLFLRKRDKSKKKKMEKKKSAERKTEGDTDGEEEEGDETEGTEGGEGDEEEDDMPKRKRPGGIPGGLRKKRTKKWKKMPDGSKAFRIPSKDIKFKGPIKMKKRFHGEAKHDMDGADPANKKVNEIVFDPALNEAVAIGEGVEEVQKSYTDASFDDTDRSEFLKVLSEFNK
ncbi:hypothetical protein PENTCL1PPCAC_30669, partial [Pristionchus entomophagus]